MQFQAQSMLQLLLAPAILLLQTLPADSSQMDHTAMHYQEEQPLLSSDPAGTRVSTCVENTTTCPLPAHDCSVPPCSYRLEWVDPLTGLPAGTTCFGCHAHTCTQRTAPPGCNTDANLLFCDPIDDPTICAAGPRAPLHPGVYRTDCIAFCHCQGYKGCPGDVGYQMPSPPPAPQHTYSNGDIFQGDLTPDGKMHGRGVYTFANGAVYRGYFRNGVQHDENATFVFANGDRYQGPYVDGKKDTGGRPTAIYTYAKDGTVYRGPFSNNARHGQEATFEFPDGRRMTGPMVLGKKHGIWTVHKAIGDKQDTYLYQHNKKIERLASNHGAPLGLV